jgi:hypothetical protein
MLAHDLVDSTDLIDCDDKIQVEANQRFYVGVDRLSADYAETHLVVLEQGKDFLQEIGFVQSDGLPEGKCFHGAGALRAAQRYQFTGLPNRPPPPAQPTQNSSRSLADVSKHLKQRPVSGL